MDIKITPTHKRYFWTISAVLSSLLTILVYALLFFELTGCMSFRKAERRYATSVIDTTYTVVKKVVPKDSVILRLVTDTSTVIREIRQGRATIIYRRNPRQTSVQANCDSIVVEKKVPVYITKQVWGVSPNYKTATHLLIGIVIALLFVYFFTRNYQIVNRNGPATKPD